MPQVSKAVTAALGAALCALLGACTQGEPDEDLGWHTAHAEESAGALYAVWGDGDELLAVGGEPTAGDIGEGKMLRHDGEDWVGVELPADTPVLYWMHQVQGELFVAGDKGNVLRLTDEGWVSDRCSTILPLWGIWGANRDDVWAVGGDGFKRDPVMCHFDGEAWEVVDLPALDVESNGLFKIWGTAADDIFAVGDGGLILHYDGESWTQQESGTDLDVIALWGDDEGNVLAVGGRASGVLLRYDTDDDEWTSQEVDTPGLNGVWMDRDGNATVVGAQGFVGSVDPGSFEVIEDESDTFLSLHAVCGLGDGKHVAVGGSLNAPPPYDGVIVQRGL